MASIASVSYTHLAAAASHGGPEGRFVLVGAAARALAGAAFRAGGKRRCGRRVHLAFQRVGAFRALDGVTQVDHLLLCLLYTSLRHIGGQLRHALGGKVELHAGVQRALVRGRAEYAEMCIRDSC